MVAEFGFETTGDDVVSYFGENVRGRVFLITGPSPGGLGAEVAVSLARSSAPPGALLLLGRSSTERYQPVIDAIRRSDTTGSIDVRLYVEMDLSDLASLRSGMPKIIADWGDRGIDVLINNAAVFGLPRRELSVDGIEKHFATNHVGHFLVTNLLMPTLLKTKHPRVVNVSALGHVWAHEESYSDYNFDKTPYSWKLAYAQSKLANIHFSQQLALLFGHRGLTSLAPHPGTIYSTNVFREFCPTALSALHNETTGSLGVREKTLSQGVSTILLAALSPALADQNGAYMSDCAISPVGGTGARIAGAAEVLWTLSEKLVDEQFAYTT